MNQRLHECLSGKHGSYILPFLWLHGETKERLYEEILAIKNSGLSEFCAESRPYENFCREQWWDDFGFILKTAKELGMRVWLLDDKKFPTGYANGYLEAEERAHLRKKLIREYQIEVTGPMKRTKLFVSGRLKKGESILSVIAYRHSGTGETLDHRSAIDLTETLSDGMAVFDVPKGVWRVCVTVRTAYASSNPSDRFLYYIDMLNKDSCKAMIDAIYEPHYERFSEYFGNTFRGFFSDEPGFLNVLGTYHNTTGLMFSPYPWREDLPSLIAESAGLSERAVRLALPALWEDLGDITASIRMHYMEVVTKLYRENFSFLLGDWCREHGVMYIGHVIEDMGAHQRLAYGSGHFFRALDGQDMAGIDIVLMQEIPGILDGIHRARITDGGAADPAFFHYTLPKLASSHAHIQPLKKGRAMCEIFGAFGWAGGLPFMKGLADLMLASGVNYFVPHAFTPKEEDPDHPPHFYNGGKNVQYPLFRTLMDYMGRVSHLLDGKTHKADVALFYNAEGEWCGGKHQGFEILSRILTQGLVDFDILPIDALKDAEVRNGRLHVNGESYGALIVSESERLPVDRLYCFAYLAANGLPVWFTDALPKESAEKEDITALLSHFTAVPTDALVSELRAKGLCHVSGTGEGISALRFYHVADDEKDIYLFANEAIRDDLDAVLTLENKGECLIYEPYANGLYRSEAKDGVLRLRIEKGNMLFVIFGEEIPEGTPYFTSEVARQMLPLQFDVFVKEEGERDFRLLKENTAPFDITEEHPHFSGEILYKARFTVPDGYTVLDLGEVGETAEATLNGIPIGVRINAPYKFSMRSALRQGENELTVLVRSNLAHRRRDSHSSFMQIPPTGVIGDVCVCKYE